MLISVFSKILIRLSPSELCIIVLKLASFDIKSRRMGKMLFAANGRHKFQNYSLSNSVLH